MSRATSSSSRPACLRDRWTAHLAVMGRVMPRRTWQWFRREHLDVMARRTWQSGVGFKAFRVLAVVAVVGSASASCSGGDLCFGEPDGCDAHSVAACGLGCEPTDRCAVINCWSLSVEECPNVPQCEVYPPPSPSFGIDPRASAPTCIDSPRGNPDCSASTKATCTTPGCAWGRGCKGTPPPCRANQTIEDCNAATGCSVGP